MTIATMPTNASAVRKHGGGRARCYPLTLLLVGRPARSTGGDLNSRGEAATSSIPLPASCVAAAYPTTGVRRARELSPSLRSNARPHAQLVEGYAPHPGDTEWPTVRHDPTEFAWHSASPACHGHTLPVSQEDAQ